MVVRSFMAVVAALLPMVVHGAGRPTEVPTAGRLVADHVQERQARGAFELLFEVRTGRGGSALLATPVFSDDRRWVAWTQHREPGSWHTAVRLKDRRTGSTRTISDRDAWAAAFVADHLLHFTARRGTLEEYPRAEDLILDIRSGEIYPIDVPETDPATGVGSLPDTWVVFSSSQDGLVPGDTDEDADVFVRNLATGEIRQMTSLSSGARPQMFCSDEQVSGDGRWVVFSCSEDLVSRDRNRSTDCYMKSIATGELRLVSVPRHGRTGRGESYCAAVSPDGRRVAFISMADGFGAKTERNVWDTFVASADGRVRVVRGARDALVDPGITQYLDPQMIGVQMNVAIGNIDGSGRRVIRLPNGELSDEGVDGIGFAPDGRAVIASTDRRFGGDRHRRTLGFYLYRR